MEDVQPGQVVSPGSANEQPAPASASGTESLNEQTQQLPPVSQFQQPDVPATYAASQVPEQDIPVAAQVPLQAEVASEMYMPQQGAVDATGEEFAWVSPALAHANKDMTWYGAYTLGAILLSAAVFFLTRDAVSTVVVLLAVGGLVVFASRKPGEEQYALGDGYLRVGQKAYALHDFKAFSVDENRSLPAATLWPLKRFMPPVSVHFSAEQGPAIVDHLALYLPMEPHKTDAIDSILHRIRF